MQIDGSITQPGLTSVKLQAYKPVENQQNTSAITSGSDKVTLSQAAKDLASAEPMRGGGGNPVKPTL